MKSAARYNDGVIFLICCFSFRRHFQHFGGVIRITPTDENGCAMRRIGAIVPLFAAIVPSAIVPSCHVAAIVGEVGRTMAAFLPSSCHRQPATTTKCSTRPRRLSYRSVLRARTPLDRPIVTAYPSSARTQHFIPRDLSQAAQRKTRSYANASCTSLGHARLAKRAGSHLCLHTSPTTHTAPPAPFLTMLRLVLLALPCLSRLFSGRDELAAVAGGG